MNEMKENLQVVEELKKNGLYYDFREIKGSGTEPEVSINGRRVLMFASNNYLSLSTHPKVVGAIKAVLKIHGMGPGGSRYLCGNVDILSELDNKLSELVGCEDSITFPTGYMANTAIFRAILDPFIDSIPYKKGSGIIFSDEFNHATIIEGCRISYAEKVVYKHINLEDLKEKLIKYKDRFPKFIVTEGVYSMEGNIAPIPEILEIAKNSNAILMIDDAHGIGVLGRTGGGVVEKFNLKGKIDIIMGSCDKALGGLGGFLGGSKKLVEFLRFASRPYLFSSALPACIASGVLKAIDLCKEDQELRKRMWGNTDYLRNLLIEAGFKIMGNAKLPAIPVYIGDENKAMEFSEMVYGRGIYSPCIRWPAVPRGLSRIRIVVMASHKKEHLEKLAEVYKQVGKELNIL